MATDGAITLPSVTVSGASEFGVARLREFVSSTLTDAALQTLLDDATAAVIEAIGEPGQRSQTVEPAGEWLALSRRASSIASVIEEIRWWNLALSADDYELDPSGYLVRRLLTGTNPRAAWCGLCRVTYTPVDDTARRIAAIAALVQLDLDNRPAVASEQIGTYQIAYRQGSDYRAQRDAILAGLTGGGSRGFVG